MTGNYAKPTRDHAGRPASPMRRCTISAGVSSVVSSLLRGCIHGTDDATRRVLLLADDNALVFREPPEIANPRFEVSKGTVLRSRDRRNDRPRMNSSEIDSFTNVTNEIRRQFFFFFPSNLDTNDSFLHSTVRGVAR